MTLDIPSTLETERWYRDLRANPSFTICKGKDETGPLIIRLGSLSPNRKRFFTGKPGPR